MTGADLGRAAKTSSHRPGFFVEMAKNLISTLGPVREWIERTSFRRAREASDATRPFLLWRELQERTAGGLSVEGRDVLEIGPGKSLGLSLIFLAAGARRVYAVDRFRHLFWDSLDRGHVAAILGRLEDERWPFVAVAKRAVRHTTSQRVSFDPGLLSYRKADGAALPLPNAVVDLSYSNAVLEHVHRPASVVRELARVTRVGGDSIHEVDFRDHFVERDRLRLLEFGEWEWQLRTRLRPGYTNRLRVGDFQELFQAAGFALRAERVTNSVSAEEVEALRPKWTRRFRNRPTEELAILSYWGWWRRT
jgi:SAM-dependent methyltransferase